LIVANNTKEHCNLLLYCASFPFTYKAHLSKKIA
jgi:hypothetical protein